MTTDPGMGTLERGGRVSEIAESQSQIAEAGAGRHLEEENFRFEDLRFQTGSRRTLMAMFQIAKSDTTRQLPDTNHETPEARSTSQEPIAKSQ